jgi:hypothetical protein
MKTLFVSVLLMFALTAFSQQKRPYNQTKLNPDFIIVKNEIWLLRQDSTIKVFDAAKGEAISGKLDGDFKASSITKDNNDNIIVTDGKKRLFRLNNDLLKWEQFTACKSKALIYTFFNSKGDCFLLTNDGIVDPSTGEKWFPPKKDKFTRQYDYYDWIHCNIIGFLDHNDNIWINADFGEFGSELFIFNTTSRKFIQPETRPFFTPIMSFCQSKRNVFSSGGEYGGGIARWVQSNENGDVSIRGNIIYDTQNNPPDRTSFDPFGVFGYIAFNPIDNSIYMSCESGLYKGKVGVDISSIAKWTKIKNFILNPKGGGASTYRGARDDNTGKERDVPFDKESSVLQGKVEFATNGKLILLDYDHGLFLFDGNKLLKLGNP